MSPSFRFARAEELSDIGRLTAHSFPGPTRTPEWWREQLGLTPYGDGPEILWVGEEGGRIVAACQLHRLREWARGEDHPTMGLGTVTIAPTHRQRGLASSLVATALRAAHDRGDAASALFPFRISFYGKLGYGLAGEAHQYRVPPDSLPGSEERFRVELAETPEARAEVRELYEAWRRGQNGQVSRTERSWEQLLSPPDRAVVGFRAASGQLEGYARVIYRVDLPPAERFLEVDELIWTTAEARRGLYGWLSTVGDQWPEVLLRALPEHRLGDWLAEPRLRWGSAPGWGLWLPAATLLGGPMFRLLDLRRAWGSAAIATADPIVLALDVHDAQLEENAGAWRLSLAEGRVQVERGHGTRADLTLGMSIQTLSRMFVGALTPSEAVDSRLATADRPDLLHRLDRVLHTARPWTFDRF